MGDPKYVQVEKYNDTWELSSQTLLQDTRPNKAY